MRVLRIYHGGRDPSHLARERALADLGVEVHLLRPDRWPGFEGVVADSAPFCIHDLAVDSAGDVNRHRYASRLDLARTIRAVHPDLVDVHEEPFSAVSRQVLSVAATDTPVVMYTAQNVDKRFPPPFWYWEKAALARVQGLYPCSAQAASVARGKGFAGLIEVIPLGYDDRMITPGEQSLGDDEIVLGLIGRMVPEKGVTDAVRVLAEVRRSRPARLLLVGDGPELPVARALASQLQLAPAVEVLPWLAARELADVYRRLHVVLVPSRATDRWTEQFGRVIVEGKAAGSLVAGYASGSIPEVALPDAVIATEGDWQGLAAGVVKMLSDDRAYRAMRTAGMSSASGSTWTSVAARQAAFYEATLRTGVKRRPILSVVDQRARSRAEFGPPAPLRSGYRPFALPLLRGRPGISRVLGRAIDRVCSLTRRATAQVS